VLVDRARDQLRRPSADARSPGTGGHAVQAVEIVGAVRPRDHQGALIDERFCDGQADALICSSDDGDFVCELEVHDRSFPV
jgi:hypothetical protein